MESAWNQHGIMLWCLLLAALWVNEHCTCLCCEQADRGQYCATHDVPWQLWYAAIGAIGCRWSWRNFLFLMVFVLPYLHVSPLCLVLIMIGHSQAACSGFLGSIEARYVQQSFQGQNVFGRKGLGTSLHWDALWNCLGKKPSPQLPFTFVLPQFTFERCRTPVKICQVHK